MKLVPVNGKIACEAPESTGVQVKISHGFARVQQKTQLTALKVLFGNEGLAPSRCNVLAPTGSIIYVSGEQVAAHQWAKQVYTHGDKQFILVPESAILMVDIDGKGDSIGTTGEVEAERPATGIMVREVP